MIWAFVLTLIMVWYGIGFLGIMFLFKINRDWNQITRFQLFWILIFWSFAGPGTTLSAILVWMLNVRWDSNYWDETVFEKEDRKSW